MLFEALPTTDGRALMITFSPPAKALSYSHPPKTKREGERGKKRSIRHFVSATPSNFSAGWKTQDCHVESILNEFAFKAISRAFSKSVDKNIPFSSWLRMANVSYRHHNAVSYWQKYAELLVSHFSYSLILAQPYLKQRDRVKSQVISSILERILRSREVLQSTEIVALFFFFLSSLL